MRNKLKLLFFTILLVVALISIFTIKRNYMERHSVNTLNIATAWNVNPNHSGLYVAIEKGFFTEQNIHVNLLSFNSVSSGKLLTAQQADMAFLSTEDLMEVNEKHNADITAIASVLSENPIYVITKESRGVFSPKEFAGKVYGPPYRYIGKDILNAMIKNDEGLEHVIEYKSKAFPLAAFLEGNIDLFLTYSNIVDPILQHKNIPIKRFYLKDYGLGNYGTPLFVVNTQSLEKKSEVYRNFLKAAQKGYEWAAQHPEETVAIVLKQVSKGSISNKNIFLEQQKITSALYLKEGIWGRVNEKELNILADYLISNGLAQSKDSLKYTNQFFE